MDTVDFVDKELTESCDQLGRLSVVVGGFVLAVVYSYTVCQNLIFIALVYNKLECPFVKATSGN